MFGGGGCLCVLETHMPKHWCPYAWGLCQGAAQGGGRWRGVGEAGWPQVTMPELSDGSRGFPALFLSPLYTCEVLQAGI